MVGKGMVQNGYRQISLFSCELFSKSETLVLQLTLLYIIIYGNLCKIKFIPFLEELYLIFVILCEIFPFMMFYAHYT